MRIAIITDLHVDLGDQESFGVDTKKNTLAILREVAKRKPDHLLILGDICLKKPHIKVYSWLKDQLAQLRVSYTIIAGNHDDVAMMAREFDLTLIDGHHYGKVEFGDCTFLCLDSSKKKIGSIQLAWLDAQIKSATSTLQYVLMHHPPIKMNVPYMDEKHSLENKDEVMEILQKSKSPVVVYSGHYHVEKELAINNVRVVVTPSCYFQLDHTSKDFRIDHHNIAYRILDISKDSARSTLHYLPGHQKDI